MFRTYVYVYVFDKHDLPVIILCTTLKRLLLLATHNRRKIVSKHPDLVWVKARAWLARLYVTKSIGRWYFKTKSRLRRVKWFIAKRKEGQKEGQKERKKERKKGREKKKLQKREKETEKERRRKREKKERERREKQRRQERGRKKDWITS